MERTEAEALWAEVAGLRAAAAAGDRRAERQAAEIAELRGALAGLKSHQALHCAPRHSQHPFATPLTT